MMAGFRELVKRWDWLLVVVMAPLMLFPTVERAWMMLGYASLLVIQWWAWGGVLPVTPLNPAILLVAVMTGVSIYVTPELAGSLTKVSGVLFGMAVYFCVVRHTRSRSGWQGGLVLFALAGMGVVAVGMVATKWSTAKFPGLNTLTSRLPIRLTWLPGAESGIHPNELAGALLWVIPVVLLALLAVLSEPGWFTKARESSFLKRLHVPGWVLFLTLTGLITTGVLVLTQSRGSYLAIAVTGLVLLVVMLKRRALWWAIGLLVVGGLAIAIVVWQVGLQAILSRVIDSLPIVTSAFPVNSLNGRVEIWSRAVWAIRDAPLTGMGMNVFRKGLSMLYPTFLLPAEYNVGHAHNELLQVALDLGLPGLVGFLALYVGGLGMLVRAIRTGGARRLLALGVMGGLVAHFLYGINDAVALGAKPGFLFWWLLGMAYGLYDQSRTGRVAQV